MHAVDRKQQLQTWLESSIDASSIVLEPASADASFRRYFRLRTGTGSLIVMDAPPEHEDRSGRHRIKDPASENDEVEQFLVFSR